MITNMHNKVYATLIHSVSRKSRNQTKARSTRRNDFMFSAGLPIICVIMEGSMPICLNMPSICFLGCFRVSVLAFVGFGAQTAIETRVSALTLGHSRRGKWS